ncbi:MAG: leucine-rich repeat protein [Clostridia bacterium]|nr:leucine-rich repeat protein [Clostridia bacterium]
MKRLTAFVLVFCLCLSGGFTYAAAQHDYQHLPKALKIISNNSDTSLQTVVDHTDIASPQAVTGGVEDINPKTIYSGTCGDNLMWTFDTDTGVLNIEGTGDMANYSYYNSLRSPWYGYHGEIETVNIANGVTTIGNYAFYDCTALTSITIPYSVTSMGESAFYNCAFLTGVTIPDSVTFIGDEVFRGCLSLENITIPDSITSIGIRAFYNCDSLTSVTIGDSVTIIGADAFYGCIALTSITIPNGVTVIGNEVFARCSSLDSITLPDSITYIGNEAFDDTAYYNNEDNWENGELYIGKHLIKASSDISGEYIIKSGTLAIADEAFWDCYTLTSVIIPDGVTAIGCYAFAWCSSLKSITLPNSVTSIGSSAFAWCSSIEYISLPDSITYIGNGAFDDTAYYNNEDNWKDGVLYIGNHLIRASNEVSGEYTIKSGTLTIASRAFFSRINPTSVIIPDSVAYIGVSAFYDCNILTVKYAGSQAEWDAMSIGECNEKLTSANIMFGFKGEEDGSSEGEITEEVSSEETTNEEIFEDETTEDESSDDEGDILYGDVNGDGAINSIDAAQVLRHDATLILLDDTALAAADVNGDGAVNSLDAAMILRFDAGLITEF